MSRDWPEIDNQLLDPTWYAKGDTQPTFQVLREDPIHWTEDTSYGKYYWAVGMTTSRSICSTRAD
ncbi:hypothetical protein ACIA03_00300 [Nocardioides sp. NPDC051685]|uniref:hypothetical protein n=1 Tax=Nocardioides sp. NPDC051685 TaxID=3364334 RepID=UPI003796FA38